MSLARILARSGPRAAAAALEDEPHRHGAEFAAALALAWRNRDLPSINDHQWLKVQHHLSPKAAGVLYQVALDHRQHDAAQALSAALQQPEARR